MSEGKFDYLIGQTCGTVSSFSTSTHDFDNVLSILNLHQDNKIIFSLQKISLFTLQNWGAGKRCDSRPKTFTVVHLSWLGIGRAPIWLGKSEQVGWGIGLDSERRVLRTETGGGGGWQQVRIAANLHFCLLVHSVLVCFSSCLWHSFYFDSHFAPVPSKKTSH